jgi:hypothetical protein
VQHVILRCGHQTVTSSCLTNSCPVPQPGSLTTSPFNYIQEYAKAQRRLARHSAPAPSKPRQLREVSIIPRRRLDALSSLGFFALVVSETIQLPYKHTRASASVVPSDRCTEYLSTIRSEPTIPDTPTITTPPTHPISVYRRYLALTDCRDLCRTKYQKGKEGKTLRARVA